MMEAWEKNPPESKSGNWNGQTLCPCCRTQPCAPNAEAAFEPEAGGCATSHKTVELAVKKEQQKESMRNMHVGQKPSGVSPTVIAFPSKQLHWWVWWLLAARNSGARVSGE